MGHDNYKFKIGQLILQPQEVIGKYEDGFITAYPINSNFNIEGDAKSKTLYDIFHTSTKPTEAYEIRYLCFPSDRNNSYKQIETLINNSSLENGIGLSLNIYPNANASFNSKTGDVTVINFNKETTSSGHTHTYLPVTAEMKGVTTHTTANSNTISIYKLTVGKTSTSPTDVENLIDDADAHLYRYSMLDLGYYPAEIGKAGASNLAFTDSCPLVDKTTGLSDTLSPFVYKNFEAGKDILYEGSYSQTSLGTNLLLITSVNQDTWGSDDEEYVRGLVGSTFMSIMPASFVINSASLEIHEINRDKTLTRTEYPDFFSYYQIAEDTVQLFDIIKRDVKSGMNYFLYQAESLQEVGETFEKEFPRGLFEKMDYYVKHKSKLFRKLPKVIKAKVGNTQMPLLSSDGAEKETLPLHLPAANPSSISVGGQPSHYIGGPDFRPKMYIILKSKV